MGSIRRIDLRGHEKSDLVVRVANGGPGQESRSFVGRCRYEHWATDTLRGTANLAVVNLGPPEAEDRGRDEADPLDAAGLGPVPDDELVAPTQPMTIRPRRRTPATDKVRISARYKVRCLVIVFDGAPSDAYDGLSPGMLVVD